jgi:TATA-binding protein-associated factor Taf7
LDNDDSVSNFDDAIAKKNRHNTASAASNVTQKNTVINDDEDSQFINESTAMDVTSKSKSLFGDLDDDDLDDTEEDEDEEEEEEETVEQQQQQQQQQVQGQKADPVAKNLNLEYDLSQSSDEEEEEDEENSELNRTLQKLVGELSEIQDERKKREIEIQPINNPVLKAHLSSRLNKLIDDERKKMAEIDEIKSLLNK